MSLFVDFIPSFGATPMTAPVRYWWEFRIWKMIALDGWVNFTICLLTTKKVKHLVKKASEEPL